MNDSQSIHRDLNKMQLPTAYPKRTGMLGPCHGNGIKPSSGHSSNYKTPYRCDQCQCSGNWPEPELYPRQIQYSTSPSTSGTGTSINTAAVTSCYNCHNASEMMLGTNLDPDGWQEASMGGTNGGSGSTSPYGRKRTDLMSLQAQ